MFKIYVPDLPVGHPCTGRFATASCPLEPRYDLEEEEVPPTINLTPDELEELEWATKRMAAIDTTGT